MAASRAWSTANANSSAACRSKSRAAAPASCNISTRQPKTPASKCATAHAPFRSYLTASAFPACACNATANSKRSQPNPSCLVAAALKPIRKCAPVTSARAGNWQKYAAPNTTSATASRWRSTSAPARTATGQAATPPAGTATHRNSVTSASATSSRNTPTSSAS